MSSRLPRTRLNDGVRKTPIDLFVTSETCAVNHVAQNDRLAAIVASLKNPTTQLEVRYAECFRTEVIGKLDAHCVKTVITDITRLLKHQ